jgi:hypothetical protein
LSKPRTFFLVLAALLVAARLCHIAILWEGDAYPLAAAGQMLKGKALYRDLWFDKPPLLPVFYTLWGALPGWPLRLAGALYALLACGLAYGFARDLWSRREGLWAAGLLGFFLIFDFPSAVVPVASDLLMLAPHIAAVWLAWKRRPFWSGVVAAVAFWISPKGLFVAAVCALWNPAGAPLMAAGWLATSGIAAAALAAGGALAPCWNEVWKWGRLYAASPFLDAPWRNGVVRTLDWLGFHAAIAVACAMGIRAGVDSRMRWIAWLAISFGGIAAGLRFFPRYYLLLLPVLVLGAARGFTLPGRRRDLAALLLLIPFLRFGPSYISAITDPAWRDTAMDRDSRAAAALTRERARPGDTLFVWGYRPEIYAYTRLAAATMYLDSQPLSGVPADRHLTGATPIETEASRARRAELTRSRPTYIVDGLGPYNPRLAITHYPDLRVWLENYRVVARTAGTVIYQRTGGG